VDEAIPSPARAAGVSKAYLYDQSDLRERIDALRKPAMEQTVPERAARPSPGKTDGSRDLVILAKDRRIKAAQEVADGMSGRARLGLDGRVVHSGCPHGRKHLCLHR
jgi:hypothetical protein